MPGASELAVRIASKAFSSGGGKGREVLRDISVSAGRGEILALLGPSGIGKTTLLRIILGLDCAFEGHVVRPDGRVGVMFQDPRLLPWLSVAGNLRLVGGSGVEIATLLAALGLAGAEALYPRTLSVGMARRVAFARALLAMPRLLVLDEPFTSLDPKSAADMGRLLTRAARQDGATVMFSTHDLDHALGFSDRVLMLAGQPARLVVDSPTAAAGKNGGGHDAGALRQGLLARFPFLCAKAAAETVP